MFDPTAFENMKVVLEGAIYDYDLDGNILVIDRNDLINLAKLSRTYEVEFQLVDPVCESKNTAKIVMTAALENLAAELLSSALSTQKAGCEVSLRFHVELEDDPNLIEEIHSLIMAIWGTDRSIQHEMVIDPFSDHEVILNTITLTFNRLVFEDQINDLFEMIGYMIKTLQQIDVLLSE